MAQLVAAGWREDRRWDTRGVAERLQRRGFELFPAAQAFLERYGGLYALGDTTVWRGTLTYFHTDPDEAATDPSWIDGRERATGTRVFPIGSTEYDDYILIMDEHGRIFGMDMYLEMTYWADDAEGPLEIVLGGCGTFWPIEPEDRRPLRDKS